MPTPKMDAAPARDQRRILVISSDPRLRERIYDALTRADLLATTAVSLESGLERLQQGAEYDLLVLDDNANCAKRTQFLERVRYFDERLPIILLTQADDEPAEASVLRSIQACLSRDADDRPLLAMVMRWVSAPRSAKAKAIAYPGPILLVDDERGLLASVGDFLRARGCTVITAASGEEALAQIAAGQPALVVLDIKMPGMDGLVTLKKIKAIRPDVTVIMGTAVEDEDLMRQASALGAYDFLLKPYNLAVLERLLLALKKRAGAGRPVLSAVRRGGPPRGS